MKKKLLITVGAGASLEFGMPSVSCVDTLFDSYASEYFSLANGSKGNLYSHIRDTINDYYGKNPKTALACQANFEETLYNILQMSASLSDESYRNPLNALFSANPLPKINYFGRETREVDGYLLKSLASILTDSLVAEFIYRCNLLPSNKNHEMSIFKQFLDALSEEFDIGIITLNYDNIFTQAKPDLITGFDSSSGLFRPDSVIKSSQWGFIYHLHGSVHFDMSGNARDMHEITWRDQPVACNGSQSSGRSSIDSMESISYLNSPIIAGYGKSNQILRTPFLTYFCQIERLVSEADSFLFLGYGFNDLHLNAMFHSIRDRNRPVTIIDWADDNQDSLHHRHDNWTYNLFKTIPANAYCMSYANSVSAADISELKLTKSFEVSNDPHYPLAVWYDGMLSACKNADKVISTLT